MVHNIFVLEEEQLAGPDFFLTRTEGGDFFNRNMNNGRSGSDLRALLRSSPGYPLPLPMHIRAQDIPIAVQGEPALLMRLFNPCVRQANCLGRL